MIYCTSFSQSTPQLAQLEGTKTSGFGGIHILGNTNEIVRDGKERARCALASQNIKLPAQKILLSFSPAETLHNGSHVDLALFAALFFLSQKDQLNHQVFEFWQGWLWHSELSIEGKLKSTGRSIGAIYLALGKQLKGIILPKSEEKYATICQELIDQANTPFTMIFVDSTTELVSTLSQPSTIQPTKYQSVTTSAKRAPLTPNFDDMELSQDLKSIALASVVGGHSILLRGTPGCGKTMFAKRLASIFPPLSLNEKIAVLQNHSGAEESIITAFLRGYPPFRAPNHHCSRNGVLGSPAQVSELELAHHGVLCLDEFPEFRRDVIEGLREPLENREIRLSFAHYKSTRPTDFILIATMNMCPCGWYGSSQEKCVCTSQKIIKYQSKISGPILNRIDIQFTMPETKYFALEKTIFTNNTANLQKRAHRSRLFMHKRNQALGVKWNRDLSFTHLLPLHQKLVTQMGVATSTSLQKIKSRRSYLKVLQLTRTLADIELEKIPTTAHFQQAIAWCCPPDNEYFS